MSISLNRIRVSRGTATGAAVAAASALILAGCSSADAPAEHSASTQVSASHSAGADSGAGAHDDADVSFAEMMMPHHQQAVDMAAMIPDHTQNADLIALGRKITEAQQSEITEMSGWLTAWGVPTTTTTTDTAHGSMDSMEHGSGSGDGMMSEEQMQSLSRLHGAEFDRQWLSMMIAHHQGAIHMARTELSDGESAQAKQLAQSIVTAQQAEIAEMQKMLAG